MKYEFIHPPLAKGERGGFLNRQCQHFTLELSVITRSSPEANDVVTRCAVAYDLLVCKEIATPA